MKPTAHILLRVRTNDGLTITGHAEVVASEGTALLGKMGKPVASAFRNKLNSQIAVGIPTYLFLTTREGWNGRYVTYRCPTRYVHDSLDEAKRALVPSYYREGTSEFGTWFEITDVERLAPEEMNRIVVLTSGRSIMSVVNSSATTFHVGIGPS